MLDHLHAIINPRDGDIARFLAQYKPAATLRVFELAQALQRTRILTWLETPDGKCLWQEGKHNCHLYSERLIWQKINYIHTNPIARGLVASAAEYPYSSFRTMYEVDGEIVIPIDKPFW